MRTRRQEDFLKPHFPPDLAEDLPTAAGGTDSCFNNTAGALHDGAFRCTTRAFVDGMPAAYAAFMSLATTALLLGL